MTTQTQTLASWLLDRIAEDEAVAQRAWPADWTTEGKNAVVTTETGLRGGWEGIRMSVAHLAMTVGNYQAEARNAVHIARHDPARVLADCAAKRKVVELCQAELLAADQSRDKSTDPHTRSFDAGAAFMAHNTLRALAQPYADAPGFREEWR